MPGAVHAWVVAAMVLLQGVPSLVSAPTNHWAFTPIAQPSIPQPRNPTWCQNGIDPFILARLDRSGISPSGPAAPRTLLRRFTLDLTGLPATPAEAESFAADYEGNPTLAVERVLDRLLASPRYGERWGRWWLDVARYADTNGQDENKVMANAWRYRDWVIRSLNRNHAFDRFIAEQIAGDLLPAADQPERNDQLTATAYLVLGPKMLAEQDKPKLVLDIIDEQVDTLGRGLLGLTLGCARCHDHKYDPVSMRDYYALAGIFRSTRSMENLDFVSKFHERWLAPDTVVQRWLQHQQALAAGRKEVEEAIRKANDALGKPLPEKPRERYPAETLARIQQLEAERDRLAASGPPEPPRTLGVEESTTTNLPVFLRGNHLNATRDSIPRHVPEALRFEGALQPPSNQSGRLELARWLTHPSHPLTARVVVNRVWQAHFGTGLVASADNFGIRGDPPSHPELLDWLATRFLASHWDLKALHRLILQSATYQQTAGATEHPSEDVDLRLLSRFPRQRMEAEMVRDSVLAASGQLEECATGTLVAWTNNEYTPGDDISPQSRRRTVYLPIVRDRVYDALTIFDFANPSVCSARRTPTVVSHQALFFLNSPLVITAAESLARQLLACDGNDADRIQEAYARVHQRPPTPAECRRALAFIASHPSGSAPASASPAAWVDLCQALLASNEFIYRD